MFDVLNHGLFKFIKNVHRHICLRFNLSFLVNWSIGAISVDSWLRETLSKSIQNRIWLAAVLSLKAFVLIT